jgi:hypothetical protein
MTLRIANLGTTQQQLTYRRSIEGVLAVVQRTQAGRVVVNHISRSTRTVTIVPYTGGGINAFTRPESRAASGTFSVGRVARGTNSWIEFSPAGSARPNVPQGRSDEILLHELSHALRQINGLVRWERNAAGQRVPLRMASYGNVEEFFAAMVASVHSSQLGRPALGNNSVWPLRTPNVLQQRPYSTRLREIRQRMPVFVSEIAAIPATIAAFNPFRDAPRQ